MTFGQGHYTTSNLASIGPVASEEKIFENVDEGWLYYKLTMSLKAQESYKEETLSCILHSVDFVL